MSLIRTTPVTGSQRPAWSSRQDWTVAAAPHVAWIRSHLAADPTVALGKPDAAHVSERETYSQAATVCSRRAVALKSSRTACETRF